MIEFFKPSALPNYPGVSHSSAAGEFVFVAGQVGMDSELNPVGVGDIEVQLERLYVNLEAACRAAGVGLADIVKTTTFITDLRDFPAVVRFREEKYGDRPPPNSTVVVSSLVEPKLLVEIEAIAYRAHKLD
jgi:2-iminobutanoate/2-iminopropanoate deaminase